MESRCKAPKSLSFGGDLGVNWRRFRQNFEIFLEASRLEKEEDRVKVALLLNFIGGEGVELYNTFDLDDAERRDLEKVVQAFQEYCAPITNVLLESVKFLNRSQAEGETVDSFLTSLEKMSEECGYGEMSDRMIRDVFVFGIRDKRVQKSLLKIHDLDLQKAVDLCRAAEAEKKDNGAKLEDAKQLTEQNLVPVSCPIACNADDSDEEAEETSACESDIEA